jgi:hypothetical protein
MSSRNMRLLPWAALCSDSEQYHIYCTLICCGAGGLDWKMSIRYSTVLYSIVLYSMWCGLEDACTVLQEV